MNKYGITYWMTYAGYIELNATSTQEAEEMFEDLDEETLLDNCDELVEIDPYSIRK